MRSHYEILGVSQDATEATIRQTYYRLLQIYHPDHNSDPEAHKRSREIIEAYSVIGDPVKRATYDNERRSSTATGGQTERRTQPPPPQPQAPAEQLVCQGCGVQDHTLRSTVMLWIFSIVLYTRRGGRSGIWCASCRAKQAFLWSGISGLCGWWGFPWGLIYTAPTLWRNAWGGVQDPEANALLLRIIGFQLYQKGELAESFRSLTASLAIRPDSETERFRSFIEMKLTQPVEQSMFDKWKIITALPSVLSTAVSVVILCVFLNQPTGYASRYEPPPNVDATSRDVETPSTGLASINKAAEELAAAVHAKATLVGTHQQGADKVREYQLDRLKYSSEEFDRIAREVEPLVGDRSVESNGIAESTYFNAKLMGQSVAVMHAFESGEDISSFVSAIRDLGRDAKVEPWLKSSIYVGSYRTLLTSLDRLAVAQKSGSVPGTEAAQISAMRRDLESTESRISSLREAGDSGSAEVLIRKYNSGVRLYNQLLRDYKRNRVLYDKADLDFNRCLDPAILLSQFQHVELTGGQQAIDSAAAQEQNEPQIN